MTIPSEDDVEFARQHARRYASDTMGATDDIARRYAAHYATLASHEPRLDFWPPHNDEFMRFIASSDIVDWRA